jgi:hypothetical protein
MIERFHAAVGGGYAPIRDLDTLYGFRYNPVSRGEKWTVHVYQEHIVNGPIAQEADELNQDENLGIGVASLIGWLKQAREGDAYPEAEAFLAGQNDTNLRYRSESDVVLIFGLMRPPARLVVLRFARGASAYPKVTDGALAAQRFEEHKKWMAGGAIQTVIV